MPDVDFNFHLNELANSRNLDHPKKKNLKILIIITGGSKPCNHGQNKVVWILLNHVRIKLLTTCCKNKTFKQGFIYGIKEFQFKKLKLKHEI